MHPDIEIDRTRFCRIDPCVQTKPQHKRRKRNHLAWLLIDDATYLGRIKTDIIDYIGFRCLREHRVPPFVIQLNDLARSVFKCKLDGSFHVFNADRRPGLPRYRKPAFVILAADGDVAELHAVRRPGGSAGRRQLHVRHVSVLSGATLNHAVLE